MRRFALALLVLLVLAGAGFAALLAAFNPDSYRADIADAVRRATGRTLSFGGPLRLHLGLSPSIEATGLALSNVEGGSRPAMLRIGRARAELALLPLLTGDLVIESLSLDGADLLLERAPDGTPNWRFIPARQALYQAPQTGSPLLRHGASPALVQIQNFHLEGGSLTWRPAGAAPVVIAIDHADASAPATYSATTLDLTGAYAGQKLTLDLRAGSLQRLTEPPNVVAGGWPILVQVSTGGASLKLQGAFNHPEEARGFDLAITGNAPDLAPLAPFLGLASLPPVHEVNLSARLVDNDTGEAKLARLSVAATDSDLSALYPGMFLKRAAFSMTGPGQPMQLDADGSLNGDALRLTGTGTAPELQSALPFPVNLSLDTAGSTVSAHGTLPPLWGTSGIGAAGWAAPGLDLTVNARIARLSSLAPVFGAPVFGAPVFGALPPLQDVVLDGQLAGGPARGLSVSLRRFTLVCSAGDLAGSIDLGWSPGWAPPWSIAGKVQSRILSLDGLLAPPEGADAAALPAPAAPAAPSEAAAAASPDRKPADLLHRFNLALDFSAGTIAYRGQAFREVGAHLALANGSLVLDPFRATTADGVVVGSIAIDGGQVPPPVRLSLRAPAFSASLLAGLIGAPDGLSGTAQLDAQLTGTGLTPAALAATATGHLGVAMTGGRVSDALLSGPIGDSLAQYGLGEALAGGADIQCLALRLDLQNGHGTVRRFGLDTTRLKLTAEGGIDFADRTLDLKLHPTLAIGGTMASAPLKLSGSFDAPKLSLAAFAGGRFGLSFGRKQAGAAPSGCQDALALARGGMAPPAPPPPPPSATPPTDLLQGVLH